MKLSRGKAVTVFALLFVFASIICLITIALINTANFKQESAQRVWLKGTYSADGRTWQNTVPNKMTAFRFHHATIKGKLSQPLQPGQKLLIVATNVWYDLSADGFSASNRRPEDSSPLKNSPGSIVRFYESEELNETLTLELDYPYTPFSNRDTTDLINLYLTGDNGIYALIINNSLALLLIAVIIGFFGLFAFPIAGIVLGGVNIRYLAFSLLSFVTGIHLVFKILYPYLPLWIDDPVLCMSLGESTIHIFCISVLVFIKVFFQKKRHNHVGNVVLAVYITTVAAVFLSGPLGLQDLYACKPFSHAVFTLCAVVLSVCMFREIKMNEEAKHALFTLIPITTALVVDALNAYLGFVNNTLLELGAILAMIYQIVNLVIDMHKQYRETIRYQQLQKELYESRVAIMISQIQPHFLYNSLTSIAMMCTLEPETAQEATIMFADYLRGNMDSLKQKTPVPFDKELEHLKKYLYIEKLRFGEDLTIVYDIQTSNFVLPQLSIQPLAENAVKHGVGMKREGGTVTIATRETDDAYLVIVSDDGIGFDTQAVKEDGRTHVGMDNVRQRLHEMCDGSVTIKSEIGKGTVATVILPKEGQQHENPLC